MTAPDLPADPKIGTVLWIGFGPDLDEISAIFPYGNAHSAAQIADISGAMLAKTTPLWVICPLFATGARHPDDAVTILKHLRKSGYRGQVYVVAPPLPAPQMIAAELAQVAGKIAVRLIMQAVN